MVDEPNGCMTACQPFTRGCEDRSMKSTIAVPALKKAAEDIDEDDSVRKTAAEALTRIGS